MRITRSLLRHGGFLILVLGVPIGAAAQCNCTVSSNPSFSRTILTAYAGQFEALVVADTLDLQGQNGGDLRAIAKLFRKTETLVRKAQLVEISGKFDQSAKLYQSATAATEKLGMLIAAAGQAGELSSTPGDRLSGRQTALATEVGLFNGFTGGKTCYGQCAEVCGDNGGCYGLAYRCQCMWNACFPTCALIP